MSNKKTYRKYAATTMAAAAAVASVAPVATAAETSQGFTDVTEANTGDHYEKIVALKELGVIDGRPDGTYAPWENLTRGQAAKMMVDALEALGQPIAEPADLEEALKGFSDINVGHSFDIYIAKAAAAGIFVGSEGKFDAYGDLSRQQMATVLVRTFKLDEIETSNEVEVNFGKVSPSHQDNVQVIANLGITNQVPNFDGYSNITRAAFASMLFDSIEEVKETPAPDVDPVVESVSAINASELQVKFSASVDKATATNVNNYQLKVNNNEISASDIANISLSEDGKVATILINQKASKGAFQNGDKYVIQTNNAIKSKDGKTLEKFVSEEKTFSETAAPSLNKIVKKGDSLELTFDRPVNAMGSDDVTLVKIDGIEIGSKELKPVSPLMNGSTLVDADVLGKAGDYRYTIEITNNTAKAEAKKIGTHEVVIFDVEDTASDYKANASVLTGSYTITDAVTAPEVTGIEAVNANRFFVYTNVPVTLGQDAVVTVNKGTHEFKLDNNAGTKSVFDDAIDAGDSVTVSDAYVGQYNNKDGIWIVVTDNKGNTAEENPLYRSGETAVNLSVTVEKYTADGLIGKKSTQNVTLNKNNTKPVVDTTSVAPNEQSLIVKFTNDLVKLDGTTPLTLSEGTDFVVRDKEGIIVTGFTAVAAGDTVTFAKGSADLKDAPYTVEFKEGKFKNAENRTVVSKYLANTVKNDAITVTVGKEASSDFKYTEFKFATNVGSGNVTSAEQFKVVETVDENSITFKYKTKMGDSARDVANYTLDGKTLPAGTTVDFINDRETVKVVFPKGTFKTSTQYKFGITTNVKTETGSMIVGSLQTKAPAELVFGVKDNVKPELASAIYYVGTESVNNQTKTKQIEVTFNEAVSVTGADEEEDFAVVINGSRFNVASVAQANSGDDTDRKLVLTLEDEINVYQAATITIVPESEQTVGSKVIAVTDTAGNKAKEGSQVTLAAGNYKYNAGLAGQIIADKALTSFSPVTITQTGTIDDNDVQYADATAVIAALPSTISVTLGDSSTVSVPVTWADTDTYDAGTAGNYTFTASWGTLPAGVNNSTNLVAPTTTLVVAQN